MSISYSNVQELVIGVVDFISGFILKNSPFPSSWFFPEKNLIQKEIRKNVAGILQN